LFRGLEENRKVPLHTQPLFWSSDPATDTVIALVQLREEIDLDHGGNEHFGIVTFDVYDLNGKFLNHTQGTVQATRITVNTDLKDLF
jgi:hypothetical protein